MADIKRFSYMGKNYDDIVADCIARIKEKYPDKWNDFYEDNIGIVIVEVFAYIADLLLYYGDRQALECFIQTASERQNLINIAKLVGYSPKNASSASADITFSLEAALGKDVIIPKGTQVVSNGGVIFETTAEAIITAGRTTITAGAVQGETKESYLGTSDGTAGQKISIGEESIVEIVSVTVDGEVWIAVDTLFDYAEADKVYLYSMDMNGETTVEFGDGINGMIPAEDVAIQATYRVGLGASGNVIAGSLTVMRDTITDKDGDSVKISVTNAAAASGGADAESTERIRNYAPRNYTAQMRCVTQSDYETKAMAFDDAAYGQIAKCHAVVKEQSGQANVIKLYVLAYSGTGLTVASSTLKTALQEYLEPMKMLTDWLEIADGSTKAVPITGVIKAKAGYKTSDITAAVSSALAEYFSIDEIEMGQSAPISDLYALIDNCEGVSSVELSAPAATVTALASEVLTLGTVTLTYA